MSYMTLKEDNFDQMTSGEGKILIDFWASWCGPCKMLAPIIDELSEEAPPFRIGKVNVDEEPALASRFQVMSIPTLVVLENGKTLTSSVGVKAKSDILDMVQNA